MHAEYRTNEPLSGPPSEVGPDLKCAGQRLRLRAAGGNKKPAEL
jgi:hypothetical protein